MKRFIVILFFGLITCLNNSWGQNKLSYAEGLEEDLRFASTIEVFPNPVVEYLNVKRIQFDGQKSRLEIMDLSGRIVYEVNETFTELSIFVGNWKKGIYMIHYQQGEVESMYKMIVQ
ncbi:T9SS type A sorting domain-containing protein [Reichenbachiella sp.]|uniref:T9SS type A sorting domain-containing protein n=1 Tax=Reichenbachiella sp. TaxID=2184521 RepID=UPI003B5BE0BC